MVSYINDMNIQKAYWSTDGDNIRLTMPLSKVDKENRIVSGWATIDNEDRQGDVILASASKTAFANFRGNIRLMHQPIPAGKLVNAREDSYYDSNTKKFYNGIYVDVYVSKGAPQIWEMVLDGTLTGFSIGGQVTDAEPQFVKDAGKMIRFIKAYDLVELSLVDSPANQLCDIVSVSKAADGTTTLSGPLAQVVAENVFWCANDEIAFPSKETEKTCTACGGATENIGWFEHDGGDLSEKVNDVVTKFMNATVEGRENLMEKAVATVDVSANAEELEVEAQSEPTPLVVDGDTPEDGVALGPDTEGDRLDSEEDALEDKEEEDDEDGEDGPGDDEVATRISGHEDEEDENAEKADSLDVSAALDELAEMLVKVNDRLAVFEAVANKFEEFTEKFADIDSKVEGVAKSVTNVNERFDAIEKNVGVKKSGDLGGSTEDKVEKSTKSIWGGRFYGSADKLG